MSLISPEGFYANVSGSDTIACLSPSLPLKSRQHYLSIISCLSVVFFCAVLHTDIFITSDFTSLRAVPGVHMLIHYMLDNYCSVSHVLIYLWRPATHTHRPLPSGPASHTHERDFSTIFSNFQTLFSGFFP